MEMMWFEWKKIFERRLNVISMLLGYVLIGVCVFSYITMASFYDEETDSYLKGLEAIRAHQEWAKGQPGVISEEYAAQVIEQIQGYGMDLESDEAYAKIIRPMGHIVYFLANNYTDMQEQMVDRNVLMEIDSAKDAGFYQRRMDKIRDYLNMDFSYGNYTEGEKEYWIKKAENIVTPFAWGDKCIMDMVWDTVTISFYLLFVVVICVSSVFASEYESGTAFLLLTARYGKDRLIYTKIAVSVLFTMGYLSVGIGLAVGIIGILFGFPGANLPVQLYDSVIPYQLTIGQGCIAGLGFALLIGISITLVLLLCSARLRSSLATLAAGMVLIAAPAFFPMSSESRVWNQINYLFPVRAVNFKEMLEQFVSYTVGSHVISYVGMAVIVYGGIGIVAFLMIRRAFVKE